MVPVAGKPVLQRNIEWLRSFGIDDLIINLHYYPESVTGYLGDGSKLGVKVSYSYEPELMGTAGAVGVVRNLLGSEPFLVVYADNLYQLSLDRLYNLHTQSKAALTMATFWREDVSASGVVELSEAGRVLAFKEKPEPDEVRSHWVNAGLYVCTPRVIDFIPDKQYCDFGYNVLPAMLAAGESLYGYNMATDESLSWIDTPNDLARTNLLFDNDLGWPRTVEN